MTRRSISRLFVAIAVCLQLACAAPLPPTARTPDSSASDSRAADAGAVDPYALQGEISVFCDGVIERSDLPATLVERIYAELELPDELPRPIDETATLGLFVNEVGVIESMKILRASAPYYSDIVTQAYARARPFPIMKGTLRDCLVGQNLIVQVFSKVGTRCVELEAFRAYQQALQDELYPLLYSQPFSGTPGRGYVRFELFVDDRGRPRETKILASAGPAATTKLKRAIEASAPFPAPSPEIFAACFADEPAILRLEVQGSD